MKTIKKLFGSYTLYQVSVRQYKSPSLSQLEILFLQNAREDILRKMLLFWHRAGQPTDLQITYCTRPQYSLKKG